MVRRVIGFADSYSIVARWRKHLYQLLNVHGFNYVRNIEMQTNEPLVSEPRDFETVLVTEKLKRHILTDTDQIHTEVFNPLNTKHRLLYLKTNSVLCSKHFTPQL
jgi:hypothetical protein